MIAWVVYGTGVSLLVAAAAALLEPVVRQHGWPQRWLWAGAMGVALVLSLALPLLWPAASTALSAGGAGAASSLQPQLPTADAPSGPATGPAAADRAVALLWLLLSTVLLLSVVVSRIRLTGLQRGVRQRRLKGVQFIADSRHGPAAAGILNTVVLLPPWFATCDRAARRLVVAHELEHIRARDPLLRMLGLGALVLLPWNLPLWWLRHRLDVGIEIDCDRRVLRRYDSPASLPVYAELLFDVTARRRTRPALALGAVDASHTLERRLIAMTEDFSSRAPVRVLLRGCAAAAAVAVIAVVDVPAVPAAAQLLASVPQEQPAPAQVTVTVGVQTDKGALMGTVMDLEGKVLAAAHVAVVDQKLDVVTDVRGRFLIPGVPAGEHTLRFTLKGYDTVTLLNVKIEAGKTLPLQVKMVRSTE